jgi:rubrerythrin
MFTMMMMTMGGRVMTQVAIPTVPYHPWVDLLNKAIADELEAIVLYDGMIRQARELGDDESVRILRYIQSQEQSHYNALVRRLEEIPITTQSWPVTVEDVDEAVRKYRASMMDTAMTLRTMVAHYEESIPRAIENYRLALLRRVEG